ncbi:hypothetical protein QL285_023532 [Trifolium repens]|nr:hypothetical protein QL285_023532 [Trifolium repens]
MRKPCSLISACKPPRNSQHQCGRGQPDTQNLQISTDLDTNRDSKRILQTSTDLKNGQINEYRWQTTPHASTTHRRRQIQTPPHQHLTTTSLPTTTTSPPTTTTIPTHHQQQPNCPHHDHHNSTITIAPHHFHRIKTTTGAKKSSSSAISTLPITVQITQITSP